LAFLHDQLSLSAMEPDRSLLGDGPYPITGPLAILARVAFLGALAAIATAVLLPPEMVPQFLRSGYLEHFAAFYVAGLLALAASPRTSVVIVATRLAIFAVVLESTHLLRGAALHVVIDNGVADFGGIAAALAPLAVARWRRRFS
jgi:hypothetical protein